MKRTIIILSVLLLAATASAQLPYHYRCQHDKKQPLEVELCSSLAAAMMRSDTMIDATDPNLPHFVLIILPTARGGYISVAIASLFIYPPLNGLALSAYFGGYIIMPDKLDDQVASVIMDKVSIGTASWMIGAKEAIGAIKTCPESVGLFAEVGVEDE